MSTDERRALAIILALLVLAAAARWLERPRHLLDDVPSLDLAELEQQSRQARDEPPPPRAARSTAPRAAAPSAATAPSAAPVVPEILDLNRATAEQLQTIRGIGPVLATRLVARRDSAGPFRTWEAVDSVAGVGPAMLARLRETTRLQ